MIKKKEPSMENTPLVILDGIKFRMTPPDVDGDGEIGNIESVPQPGYGGNISHVQERSELGESMDKLDADEVDETTQMSQIDFNANLNPIEKNCFGVLDFLVSVNIMTPETQFLSRRFKRLSVSVGGKGRDDKVAMVTGQRDHQRGLGGSIMDSLKGFFGQNENK